jgi:hypothetical protein
VERGGQRWRGGRIIYGFGFAEEIAIVGMIKVRGCTLFSFLGCRD